MCDETTTAAGTKRIGYLAAGWISVGLGTIGAFLPVMPTTCFMIAALWFFSKSSPALAQRLLEHPRYGAPLRAWVAYRAIPAQVKVVAIASIVVSAAIVLLSVNNAWVAGGVVLTLIAVAFYIATRPTQPETVEVMS